MNISDLQFIIGALQVILFVYVPLIIKMMIAPLKTDIEWIKKSINEKGVG